jgi:uncharacterized protein (TIGR03435 family)
MWNGATGIKPTIGGEVSHSMQRAPVVDMTGLTGRYDFSIDLRAYLPRDANWNLAPAGPVRELTLTPAPLSTPAAATQQGTPVRRWA